MKVNWKQWLRVKVVGLSHLITSHNRQLQGVMWLTFSLRDRAADGGAGGGDGAHRRAHAIWRVYPSHRRRVGHPCSWVDGSDWLACLMKHRRGSWSSDLIQDRITQRQRKKQTNKIHSLLGRAKQPRGFGSQHLATVRVMGLVLNTETKFTQLTIT